MAVFTRSNGDAKGVVQVDQGRTAGNIIATGLTKNPTTLVVTSPNTLANEMGTGGAVETILRAIAQDSTIVMYQVDAAQISVLVEALGSNVSTLQTRVQALGANIGSVGNVQASTTTVTNAVGFKLATS